MSVKTLTISLKRLHLLMKLNSFRVRKHVMGTVYQNLMEGILTFNMTM